MSEFPVDLPEGALSWESQICQYRDAEPPQIWADPPRVSAITYYAGTVEGSEPVDCLLYWVQDPKWRIVGILNHYPVDYPPWEKAGNVNVWVRRSHQRRGVGTALALEAKRRWDLDLDAQRFTESGSAFARALRERKLL